MNRTQNHVADNVGPDVPAMATTMKPNQFEKENLPEMTTAPIAAATTAGLDLAEPADDPTIVLSEQDQAHLEEYEEQRALLLDRTIGVAQGYHTGAYITGPPGTGKTWTVTEGLDKPGIPYTMRNSRMTPKGLFHLLQGHPNYTIILDDISTIFTERYAQQILLAALGGKGGQPRRVTLTTAEVDGSQAFEFTGGIIAISNRPLDSAPLAKAIESRVPVLEFAPSIEAICAFIRHLATGGSGDLSPAECMEVANFVIGESRSSDFPIDVRAYEQGLGDFRQWKDGLTEHHWHKVVRSGMRQLVSSPNSTPQGRAATKAEEQRLVIECNQAHPDKPTQAREAWRERTGKSISAYSRRLSEVKAAGWL